MRHTLIAPVIIAKRAFIGAGAIVLAGSRIGDDVMLGAGAVVSGDIPAGSVVAGNPAKIFGDVESTSQRHRRAASQAPRSLHDGWTLTHGITEKRKRVQRTHWSRGSPDISSSPMLREPATDGTHRHPDVIAHRVLRAAQRGMTKLRDPALTGWSHTAPDAADVGAAGSSSSDVRIAFLTDIMTPYVVAVLDELAKRSDLIALFCSRTGTRGMAWQLRSELPFRHEVVEGITILHPSRDATDYYLSPRIAGALRRARPQVVISAGFSIPSVYAAAYGRLHGIPLLISSDGTAQSEARLRPEQRLGRRVLRRAAWGVVANSEPAARRFVEMGFLPGRVFRAPHATQIEPFWEVAEHRRPTGAGPLRLLSVGRVIPRKGIDLLLQAAAEARRSGADVELTVVGTGSDEARLRALAEKLGLPVSWRGFVDQPELPQAYAEANAFAFPTLNDPFGMVVLEAAAAGLPLIASPFAGATEDLIQDGVQGFVVDPRNTAAMAAAIGRLAGSPELRIEMGRAAHAATIGRTPATTAAGYMEAVDAAIRMSAA